MKKRFLFLVMIITCILSGCDNTDIAEQKSQSSSQVSSAITENEKEPLTKEDATARDASFQVNIKYIRKFYTDLTELTSKVDKGEASLLDVYNYCESWTKTDINSNLENINDEYSQEYRKSLNLFYSESKELARSVMEYAKTGSLESATKMQESTKYYQLFSLDVDEARTDYLISAGYTADEIKPVPEVEE